MKGGERQVRSPRAPWAVPGAALLGWPGLYSSSSMSTPGRARGVSSESAEHSAVWAALTHAMRTGGCGNPEGAHVLRGGMLEQALERQAVQ